MARAAPMVKRALLRRSSSTGAGSRCRHAALGTEGRRHKDRRHQDGGAAHLGAGGKRLHQPLGDLTVRENVLLMTSLAGMPREDDHREVDALLEELSLSGMADRRSTDLSGGEEQRVALARHHTPRCPAEVAGRFVGEHHRRPVNQSRVDAGA
jgi:hypothetical protein